MYDCHICAINETGLNGEYYLEVSNLYRWVGTNRGNSGGAGFIMKIYIRYERVVCDCEDISLIKIGRVDRKFEWLLGRIYIYMNYEGIRREENDKKHIIL